ncbi:MAG TPA: amidophosphoribosyltransferase [Mycobacterium sp.]|nr:amidophosphoribosyltransferase [Mycobacterium sp.]
MMTDLATSTSEQMRRTLLSQPLFNVIRDPMCTCLICGTSAIGFEHCWRCRDHRRIAGVADIVAPLSYAISGTESARLLRNYKNHPVRSERERCAEIVAMLLGLGVSLHEPCLGALVGLPVTARVVIPSLTSRPGTHPLSTIAGSLGLLGEAKLLPAVDARCDRTVTADKFAVAPVGAVAGRHILILDDVWTTGSNAQSAAVTLRNAGAAAVSVMVIGRWLNRVDALSARLIEEWIGRGYDPLFCPATGGRCPTGIAGAYGCGYCSSTGQPP